MPTLPKPSEFSDADDSQDIGDLREQVRLLREEVAAMRPELDQLAIGRSGSTDRAWCPDSRLSSRIPALSVADVGNCRCLSSGIRRSREP